MKGEWVDTFFDYSGMPKSEHVRISNRWLLFGANLVQTTKTSEIRTICSVIRREFLSEIETAYRSNIHFSDVSTRLDRFIYKFFYDHLYNKMV